MTRRAMMILLHLVLGGKNYEIANILHCDVHYKLDVAVCIVNCAIKAIEIHFKAAFIVHLSPTFHFKLIISSLHFKF